MTSMLCAKCSAPLDNDSAYCTGCGAPTETTHGSMRMEAEKRLAGANLARMRSKWLDAETGCIEVMRSDPNNLDAHSLLGDIYRDQGRLDEAEQWYRMALDVDPSSARDKEKAEWIEQERRRRERKPALLQAAHAPAVRSDASGTQNLMGLSPVWWLRGLTILSIVFFVLAIVVVAAMRGRGSGTDTIDGGSSRVLKTGGSAGGPRPLGEGTPREAVPIPASPKAARNGGAGGQLQDNIARAGVLESLIQIESVTSNPGDRTAAITLRIAQSPPESDLESFRSLLLRNTFRAGRLLFDLAASVESVKVVIRVTGSDVGAEALLGITLERRQAVATPLSAEPEQMLAALKAMQWASHLAPGESNMEPQPAQSEEPR